MAYEERCLLGKEPGNLFCEQSLGSQRWGRANHITTTIFLASIFIACSSEEGSSGRGLADSMSTGMEPGLESSPAEDSTSDQSGMPSNGKDSGEDESPSSDSTNPTGSEPSGGGGDDGQGTEGNRDEDEGSEAEGMAPRFDVEIPDAAEEPPAIEDNGHIWIANSPQGTVSKIGTESLIELGRYVARPDGAGDPSRTSVNLEGDVAVANRKGGITKIYAQPGDCDPNRNGRAGTQTSRGADFLAWADEDCIAWYTPMDYGSQRAIAWGGGVYDPDTDTASGEKVWVTGNRNSSWVLDIYRLNGDTGAIEANLSIDFQAEGIDSWGGGTPFPWLAYGGAVNGEGDFWFSNRDSGYVARIDFDTLEKRIWKKPYASYGVTVDPKGRVWTCDSSVARFDPTTESWSEVNGNFGHGMVQGGNTSGCMMDEKGRVWVPISISGGGHGIAGFNGESLAVEKVHRTPAYVKGISIDFNGKVWAVGMGSDAWRVDPEDGTIGTFSGLVGPYTYSDMTGFALHSVVKPPVE